MTILVAALCEEGIVLGTDSMRTTTDPGGHVVGTGETKKIRIIAERKAAFLHTGDVGTGQQISDALDRWARSYGAHKKNSGEVLEAVKQEIVGVLNQDTLVLLGKKLQQGTNQMFTPTLYMQESARRLGSGIVAIQASDGVAAVQFEGIQSFTRLEAGRLEFFVAGSGMTTGDSFMEFVRRVVWRSAIPSQRKCMLGVFWAIQHAILRGGHSGVGGKPDLALLEMSAGGKQRLFKEAEQADIDQLEQEIADLEEKIGAFQDAPVPKDAEVPAPPETTASKPSG